MSHQQLGHTGPQFKASSDRKEKREIDLATPRLVVQHVSHYTTASPATWMLSVVITRMAPITTAADDSLEYFFIVFQRK